MGWDEPNEIVNTILGIVLVALGGLLTAEKFGWLPFKLPSIINSVVGMFLVYILAAVGLWLIIDGFMEWDDWPAVPSLILGLVILAIGAINILESFKVISFAVGFIPQPVYYALFVVEGVLMISYNAVT